MSACGATCVYGTCGGGPNPCGGCCRCMGGCLVEYEEEQERQYIAASESAQAAEAEEAAR